MAQLLRKYAPEVTAGVIMLIIFFYVPWYILFLISFVAWFGWIMTEETPEDKIFKVLDDLCPEEERRPEPNDKHKL